MKKLPLNTIVEIINGRVIQGSDNLIIHEIVTGRKRLKAGTLLLDLRRGHDGNPKSYPGRRTFAVATDRPLDFMGVGNNATVIQVENIAEAYWKFVDFYRNMFHIPVIGVTGTCGKTTTKEMIKHILSGKYMVNATYKSYNAMFRNLGYLLDIDEGTQAAVIEMGVAYPGDLQASCRYFKPQVGIITNIGVDHLRGLGTLDAYIKAKAEIMEGMGFEGTLILNADDENIKKINLKRFKGRVITFGLAEQSHFRVVNISHQTDGLQFDLRYGDGIYHLSVPGHGEFNALNAAAAIAAAHVLGLSIGEAGARLAFFQNVEKHFEFKEGINGSTIIDDTWSTNPTSVEAALKLLKSLSQGKKTVAVLGQMSLLGRHSGKYHRTTGEIVAEIGVDLLIVLGDGADEIGRGALQSGMAESRVWFCKSSDDAYEALKRSLDQDTIVLVKTSMLASYKDLTDQLTFKNPNENHGGNRNVRLSDLL